MKPLPAFDLMEDMRELGFCVVLKCLPKEIGWLVEGSRSEYDAPCPDQRICAGMWCCEATHLGSEEYWNDQFAFGDDPLDAVKKVFFRVCDDKARREKVQQDANP